MFNQCQNILSESRQCLTCSISCPWTKCQKECNKHKDNCNFHFFLIIIISVRKTRRKKRFIRMKDFPWYTQIRSWAKVLLVHERKVILSFIYSQVLCFILQLFLIFLISFKRGHLPRTKMNYDLVLRQMTSNYVWSDLVTLL